MNEHEQNPELTLAQLGWKRIKENVKEADNAKRVIEVDIGNGVRATFYTEQENASLPEGIDVKEDFQDKMAA